MIIEQVLSHLQPKSVILMHDTHISTVEAIDVLIPIFRRKLSLRHATAERQVITNAKPKDRKHILVLSYLAAQLS